MGRLPLALRCPRCALDPGRQKDKPKEILARGWKRRTILKGYKSFKLISPEMEGDWKASDDFHLIHQVHLEEDNDWGLWQSKMMAEQPPEHMSLGRPTSGRTRSQQASRWAVCSHVGLRY